MIKSRFTHIHASMRFDRPNKDLREQVVNLVAKSDLLTLTEVSKESREAVLRDVAEEHGWGVLTGDKGGADDSAILWDKERFELIAGTTRHTGTVTYNAPGGRSLPTASFAVLRDKPYGKKMLVSVSHLASSVEHQGRFVRNSIRVKSWRSAQKGWRTLWNSYAKKHLVDGVLICADWNVNIKTAYFRSLFKTLQPGMNLVLDVKNMPARGTLGRRIIDFTFIKGKLQVASRPVILAHDDSSDHTPYMESLSWRM